MDYGVLEREKPFWDAIKIQLGLPLTASTEDVLKKVDNVVNSVNEYHRLKGENATLKIDKLTRDGIIKEKDKETYQKLAVKDLAATLEVVYSEYEKESKLSALISKSGRELYFSGGLAELKKLSTYWFDIKYKELQESK